jgi:GNAT superfamily N-acetyltransferase
MRRRIRRAAFARRPFATTRYGAGSRRVHLTDFMIFSSYRALVMRISYLADFPDASTALIPGLLDHWRYILPEQTAESRAARFEAHMNRDVLPIAWVAHIEDRVAGTAALRIHDLEGREDLTPWLGGVYVLPEFRRRGIASALCRAVEEKARRLGFQQLFLFTLDQQALYQSLGWRPHQPAVWRGHQSKIMQKQLAAK